MKLQLPTLPNIKFVNKRVVYIVAGAVIVALIIAIGIVQQVRADRLTAAESALEVQRQKDRDARLVELEAANEDLKNIVMFERSKTNSVCDWVRSTAPKARLTVPPLCVKS
jgi:type VI protein secretion system component VasK